jgi:putative DNA primase/helicase
MAEEFLHTLTPEGEQFTFQTFTDSKQAREQHKRDPLARVLHGTLSQLWNVLVDLSAAGAGVYVTVNETNLRGRAASDVVRVRAYFVDLDGASIDNLNRLPLKPHIVAETSPGKFHAYWRPESASLDGFKATQKRLADLMGGDEKVCDLPRVMRLPGFPHQKEPKKPFLVQILECASLPAYSDQELHRALDDAERKMQSASPGPHRASISQDIMAGLSFPPDMTQGFPDGQRTAELVRRAGWCLGPQNMTEEQATAACLEWNNYNNPPLSEEKIRSTVASISRAENKKRENVDRATFGTSGASSHIAEGIPKAGSLPEPQATFVRLAGLPGYLYDPIRKREADRLNLRVITLDKAVDIIRAKLGGENVADDDSPGRPLTLPLPEPWHLPVDGRALLYEITTAIHRYVVLPPDAIVAVALFVVYCHAYDTWNISPRLAITSPEMQCGKTTLLSVLEGLVPKPLKADNVTAAAVFRVVEQARPTLLIDEADSFLKDNEELRGVLNSGHRSNGQVVRLVGENHEPRAFSTFCPTVIAAIGRLPSTLEDRSISVSMRRALPNETVTRFDEKERAALVPLAQKARRWTDDHKDSLHDLDSEIPDELHGRAADNWRPLLVVADEVGGRWFDLAREAAVRLSVRRDGQESVRVQLLMDIRSIFGERDIERISSADLVAALGSLEGRPWQDWGKGRPITPNQLARQLAHFEIKPRTMRMGKEQQPSKGYERSDFSDAFKRYLPLLGPSDKP